MKMTLFLVLLWCFGLSNAKSSIFWVSQPVKKGDVVLVYGYGLNQDTVQVNGKEIRTIQPNTHSLKFVLPDLPSTNWKLNVDGAEFSLNTPTLKWYQFDWQESTVEIFGVNLAFDGSTYVKVNGRLPAAISAKFGNSGADIKRGNNWHLTVKLPSSIRWDEAIPLFVNNGLMWANLGKITLPTVPPLPASRYEVKDWKSLKTAVQSLQQQNGGRILLPDQTTIQILEPLTLPPYTQLLGNGKKSVLEWVGSNVNHVIIAQQGVRLRGFSLVAKSTFDKSLINLGSGSVAENLTITQNLNEVVGQIILSQNAQNVRVQNNVIIQQGIGDDGNCGEKNQKAHVFASEYSSDLIYRNNKITYTCRVYYFECSEKIIFEKNTMKRTACPYVGQTQNVISTYSNDHFASELIYFADNTLDGGACSDKTHPLETFTLDGSGGLYHGAASLDGKTLTLKDDPEPLPTGKKGNWAGGMAVIYDGAGSGSYTRVKNSDDHTVVIDGSFSAFDKTSRVQITQFRGNILFLGNNYRDGSVFQLYDTCIDCVVSGNKFAGIPRVQSWGMNPHGYGVHPNYFVQYLDNDLDFTDAAQKYFGKSGDGFFGTYSKGSSNDDEQPYFSGPYNRAQVFRRNSVVAATINIQGRTADVVVQDNDLDGKDVKVGNGLPKVHVVGNH